MLIFCKLAEAYSKCFYKSELLIINGDSDIIILIKEYIGETKMKDRYKTVKNMASAEIVEKRSRFIASVKPVESEQEAVEFINELRKKYWDASHNVYAYILEESGAMRYSDDGEPSGTAGMPVLDMLKKEGITNTAVVVTRYFGGILLGTGGLVHTYSKSAKAGVLAANVLEMILCREITIVCDYNILGKIQNELHSWEFIQGGTLYTDNVELSLFVPISDFTKLAERIVDISNGTVKIIEGSEIYKEKIQTII